MYVTLGKSSRGWLTSSSNRGVGGVSWIEVKKKKKCNLHLKINRVTIQTKYLRICPSDFRLNSFRGRNGVLRRSRFVEGVETWRGIDVGGILGALRWRCQHRNSSTFDSRLITFFRPFGKSGNKKMYYSLQQRETKFKITNSYLMNTLKSGPASESTDSVLFTLGSGGGAVMLKNESNPSLSPNPVTAVSDPVAEESPQTEHSTRNKV